MVTGNTEVSWNHRRPRRFFVNHGPSLFTSDLLAWMIAYPLAFLLRTESLPSSSMQWLALASLAALAAIIQSLSGLAARVYRGRYIEATLDEAIGVAVVSLSSAAVTILGWTWLPQGLVPGSVVVLAWFCALAFMAARRLARRLSIRRSALARPGRRTLLIGAGTVATHVVNLLVQQQTELKPVGVLEAARAVTLQRVAGLPVLGTVDDLQDVASRHRAEVVLVADVGIDARQLRDIDVRCSGASLELLVVPSLLPARVTELKLSDLSPPTDEDLLGRRSIAAVNEQGLRRLFSGEVVLVTGAGGSIGRELAQQVAGYGPGELLLLDRDESALLDTALALTGRGDASSPDLLLCDIRNHVAVDSLVAQHKPSIIFHAAALKHLAFLERFPGEAFHTNVLGTMHLLDSARRHSVGRFVNVSTDKAADPSSVLGFTKRIAERLTAHYALEATTGDQNFVSVRFGNVVGSRGSVVETFHKQIARGGPVTVTDLRATRFMMSKKEATHLLLQAVLLGRPGETLILDMGEPIKIIDIAEELIRRSGREVPVIVTGLRPGEKLHENLLGKGDHVIPTPNSQVTHASVEPLDPNQLRSIQVESIDVLLLQALCDLQVT